MENANMNDPRIWAIGGRLQLVQTLAVAIGGVTDNSFTI